jgi:hypothetical protein
MEYQGVNKIGELIEAYKPKKIQVVSRGQWLSRFLYKLQQDYNGVEPLSRMRVGVALKRFQDWELPVLWARCEESDCFAKNFWWMYKQKPPLIKEKKPKQKTLL